MYVLLPVSDSAPVTLCPCSLTPGSGRFFVRARGAQGAEVSNPLSPTIQHLSTKLRPAPALCSLAKATSWSPVKSN